MPSFEIRRLERVPDAGVVLASRVPGAMLFDGWCDERGWRFLLAWPDEIRELPWERAGEWKPFVDALEHDAPRASGELPFSGGWAGFLAYETTALDEGAPLRGSMTPEPAAFFALHTCGIAVDPRQVAWLFGDRDRLDELEARLSSTSAASAVAKQPSADVDDSLGHGLHARLVQRIRDEIRDGEVYQVNLTRSYTARTPLDAASLYDILTTPDPPRSSAFILGSEWAVVSASPEVLLVFDRETGTADSLPIKGTVARRGQDDREIAQLLASEKDESEHLMIVDVVRNDFGKIAPPGGVTVPEYRALRKLRHVHHLESTVRATGLGAVPLSGVLAALSPAASITGAPKRAAVKLIREIEPVPRGVYCGSIGMLDATRARFSVAIRTAVVTDTAVRYHAGGGIVWDSVAEAEEAECRAKSAAFLGYVAPEKTS